MSTIRPAGRINESTRYHTASIPLGVIERTSATHVRFTCRDLNPGPATLVRKWTAKPSEGEAATVTHPKAHCDAGAGKGRSVDHPSTGNFMGKEAR